MPRATPRPYPRPDTTRRELRLAALRTWKVGEDLDLVAARLKVRPGWLYEAIKQDIAAVQRHFGHRVTAEDLVIEAHHELHLTRDKISSSSARNFAAYCIRRLYARQELERERRRRRAAKKKNKTTDEYDAYMQRRAERRRARERQRTRERQAVLAEIAARRQGLQQRDAPGIAGEREPVSGI